MSRARHLGVAWRAGGLAASLALALGACQEPQKPRPHPPVAVSTTQAISADVPRYLQTIGTCLAMESVTILPQIGGPIVGIHFTDGQEVKAGDPLFSIDPRPYQAALDKAVAQLVQDEATLQLNKAQLQRSKDLVPGDFLSPQSYDTLVANVAAAEGKVAADRSEIETARINLGYCRIVSPIDGKAGARQVDLGNVVAANTTKLVTIQRMDPIYAQFTLPENQLGVLREAKQSGRRILVEAASGEGDPEARLGNLYFLDNMVDTDTGTLQLRSIMPNPDRAFWPGQFVRVRVLLDTLRGAVLVPQGAVQLSQKGKFVFVINAESKAEQRPVRVGQRHRDLVVIEEGVKAGEAVVTAGQLMLQPGSEVSVKDSQPIHYEAQNLTPPPADLAPEQREAPVPSPAAAAPEIPAVVLPNTERPRPEMRLRPETEPPPAPSSPAPSTSPSPPAPLP